MCNILIIEDMDLIASDLEYALSQAGHNVIGKAENVDSALSIAKKSRISVAIVDINLSGKYEGIELSRILHDEYCINIIFVSAFQEELIKGLDFNFAFLSKPYNEHKLLLHLKELCNKLEK